jgi:predicted Zn-dependent protease
MVGSRHALVRDVASLLGLALLTRSGAAAQAAGAVGQALAATRQVAYNRQLEMEADTLGARYMAAAGYDPKGALAFLKTLDQERTLNPIDIPPYMMTHPVTQERVANVELVIRSLPTTEAKSEEPDPLEKVQAIIRVARQEGDAVLREHEKKLAENPDSAERFYLLGFAQQLMGRMVEALHDLEPVLAESDYATAFTEALSRFRRRTMLVVLTDLVEEAVYLEFERLAERGGVLGAMETMYQRSKIQEESLYYEQKKHDGSLPIIGVNTFKPRPGEEEEGGELELIRSTEEEKQAQLAKLQTFQAHNTKAADQALARLKEAAAAGDNLFAELMEAVKVCSLGQITHALYEVGGQYRRSM